MEAQAPLQAAMEAFVRVSNEWPEVVEVALLRAADSQGLTVIVVSRQNERFRLVVKPASDSRAD